MDLQQLPQKHIARQTSSIDSRSASTPNATDWMLDMACRDINPRLFAEPKVHPLARFACAGCPTKTQCLEFMLEGGKDQADYAAGLFSDERRELVIERAAA